MCVNNLSKVALDSAAAGIEPAISSRKSNALTTTPPSHTNIVVYGSLICIFFMNTFGKGSICIAYNPLKLMSDER